MIKTESRKPQCFEMDKSLILLVVVLADRWRVMCKCIDLNGKDGCGLTQFMNAKNNKNETFKSNFQPLWQKFYPNRKHSTIMRLEVARHKLKLMSGNPSQRTNQVPLKTFPMHPSNRITIFFGEVESGQRKI